MALHHKFVVRARSDHQFIESRNVALDSAKQALFYQGILADVPPNHPGGAKQSWRLLSLLTQDFLFAALVVSLDLDYDLREGNPALDATRAARVEEHLKLLQTSHRIWKQCLDHSAGAQQAYDILGAMLVRFSQAQLRNGSSHSDTDFQPKAFQETMTETTILHSQSSTAFPESLMSPSNDFNPFTRGDVAAPYSVLSTSALDSFTFNNEQVDSNGVDYDMVDTLLLGSEWPDLDFTIAVGML
jgi:hypothetical protein